MKTRNTLPGVYVLHPNMSRCRMVWEDRAAFIIEEYEVAVKALGRPILPTASLSLRFGHFPLLASLPRGAKSASR